MRRVSDCTVSVRRSRVVVIVQLNTLPLRSCRTMCLTPMQSGKRASVSNLSLIISTTTPQSLSQCAISSSCSTSPSHLPHHQPQHSLSPALTRCEPAPGLPPFLTRWSRSPSSTHPASFPHGSCMYRYSLPSLHSLAPHLPVTPQPRSTVARHYRMPNGRQRTLLSSHELCQHLHRTRPPSTPGHSALSSPLSSSTSLPLLTAVLSTPLRFVLATVDV